MRLRFEGRTAIITGGAKGIGRATASRLLSEGGNAIVIDRERDDSEWAVSLRAENGAADRLFYYSADVTDETQVSSAMERGVAAMGEADILINNAGYGAGRKPIETITRSEWDEILQVNITTTFLMTQAALPAMRKRGYGRVVNMSSSAGRTASPAQALSYATAKAGLLGFTRKLAYEEAKNGITVNAVAPGTIFTDRVRKRFEQQTPEQQISLSLIPMGRPGRPEEVAAVILFLASDDASYVTGVVWDINGGKLMA